MHKRPTSEIVTGWADLFADGRLSRFVLICLGIWLTAVDSLVVATILPSVGAELGGYAWFGWVVSGFLIGAVVACASAGRLSEVFGLRAATSVAGSVFALGCVINALAQDMNMFVLGRLVQGIGGGWISGFAMVAIAALFPERHLARVFASASAIWGVATLLGPMVGGLFAQAGDWRGVFWLFALQAVIFAAAAFFLLKNIASAQERTGIPWRQLATLTLGVGAIAFAGINRQPILALALTLIGLGLLALILRLDAHARVRLLPHRAGDLRTICGAGYAAMFMLTAASMGLTVYGPMLLQQLRGLSPLWAGYSVGAEALAWTLAAFAVAGVSPANEGRWIRRGGCCVLLGAAGLALSMRAAPLAWVLLAVAVMGAGFGFSSSLMNRRVLRVLSGPDRAIGSSALIAVRQTGGAVGAALAGAVANLVGLGAALNMRTAHAAAVWVFVSLIPPALAGAWAAWRMTGNAVER